MNEHPNDDGRCESEQFPTEPIAKDEGWIEVEPSPPANVDRITVNEMVYHQPWDDQPTVTETRYSRELENREQVYRRKITLDESWRKFDIGWIENPDLIIVRNEEGRRRQVIPTPEELEEESRKDIEITDTPDGLPISAWIVRPRETHRGCHTDHQLLRIRCRSGTVQATITVHPS